MNDLVKINDLDLQIREFNGQRVVTLKDIDILHQRSEGTSRRNFNQNKKHLIADEDYFVRNSYEAKEEFEITAPSGLTLLTESGYLMLVKSLQDDLAWKVQRELVKNYFRVKSSLQISKDITKEEVFDLIKSLPNDEHKNYVARMIMGSFLPIEENLTHQIEEMGQKVEMSENVFRNLVVEFMNENDVVIKRHKQGLVIDKDALYKYFSQYGWTQHDVLEALDKYKMIYHKGEDRTQQITLDGKLVRALIIQ